MKALVLTSIKAPLELQQRDGLKPNRGEVVVRLKAAALNRRDYWITQGMYPGIEPPVVLGSDGAGIVAQIGEGVDSAWMDREVVINPGMGWGDDEAVQSDQFTILGLPHDGTLATEVLVPVENLHTKPKHLDWHEAAAIPLSGVTAWRALFSQGGLAAGQTVLISGIGGGVATFAMQFAVAAGARVWVTSSSRAKIERAIELGAVGGFDYTDDSWPKQMSQAPVQPNLIIDSAGGPGYRNLLSVAAPGARIVNYGATAGPPEKVDLFKVFWKQLQLRGSTMGSPGDFRAMIDFIDKKRTHPIVEAVTPLDAANRALQLMQTSPQFGKYVLSIE